MADKKRNNLSKNTETPSSYEIKELTEISWNQDAQLELVQSELADITATTFHTNSSRICPCNPWVSKLTKVSHMGMPKYKGAEKCLKGEDKWTTTEWVGHIHGEMCVQYAASVNDSGMNLHATPVNAYKSMLVHCCSYSLPLLPNACMESGLVPQGLSLCQCHFQSALSTEDRQSGAPLHLNTTVFWQKP